MHLSAFEIANYRSLEQVVLEDLQQFNVLIGRNNSGKSSVFGAIDLINRSFQGIEAPWHRALTALDTNRSLAMRLQFAVLPHERQEFLKRLASGSMSQTRQDQLLQSPFLSKIEYLFRSVPGKAWLLNMYQTRLVAEDGEWAVVQKLAGGEETEHPTSRVFNLAELAAGGDVLRASAFNMDSSQVTNVLIHRSERHRGTFHPEPSVVWPLEKLTHYLKNAYFFNPFRHSASTTHIGESPNLLQDGANLASVLHYLLSNNRPVFYSIERFIQAALPDIGELHAPVRPQTETEIGFRVPDMEDLIPLQDMGGGVEQLLMVATVLHTTGIDRPLFIEEPESHLHAGAQRFLIERLREDGRQVFITTHSPTFVNVSPPASIYQVSYEHRRTHIRGLTDPAALGHALADIGARNSDVLLSDAVLFVEGPGDRDVFTAWSHTLGMSLEEHNVTVLSTGGAEHVARHAPIRSELLEGISQKAPVPHLFVLDRDERSESEINRLQTRLGECIHFLERRELENYLLAPRALIQALRQKCEGDAATLDRIDATSEQEVIDLIRVAAEGLQGRVLLKRIRSELPGLREGLLPRATLEELIPFAADDALAQRLAEALHQGVSDHLASVNVETLVQQQREALDQEWADPDRRLELAPGEELISAVFQHFGRRYDKAKDTLRIAQCMHADEIPGEIHQLLTRIVALSGSMLQ